MVFRTKFRHLKHASITPSSAQEGRSLYNTAPGRLSMQNQTLRDCIRIAYGVKVAQVSGGAKWAESERFDIEAKAKGPAGDRELMMMLQALLKTVSSWTCIGRRKWFPDMG